MKILYIHRTRCRGVEGVHINSIVESFERLGHGVDLFSPYGIECDNQVDPNKNSARRNIFVALSKFLPEFFFELAEIGYNLLALSKLKKIFSSDKVDLIYERYAIFSVVGVTLAKLWGKPIILEINYTSQSPLVRKRSRLMKPLARRFDRYIYGQTTAFVAVSNYLKDLLVNDYGVDSGKIVVLPNAADPGKLSPYTETSDSIRRLVNYKKVIGFVGGFYPWHGLDLLLDTFSFIAESQAELGLVLIGDGPERERIERRVVSSGLASRVVFAGKVEHNQLSQWINMFDVGIMPDSNVYGSPMKVFEYMAMGKPVIVPDYGPLRDAVKHGREGLFFKPGDMVGLAKSIQQILGDDELYEMMSKNARRRIIEERNWLENAKLTLALIDLGGE